MQRTRRLLARLWTDARAITAVEYALLLAMVAGGIIMGAEFLSGAVSNQMSDTALWFGVGGDGCGNTGGGDGTGGDGGSGGGGGNTC